LHSRPRPYLTVRSEGRPTDHTPDVHGVVLPTRMRALLLSVNPVLIHLNLHAALELVLAPATRAALATEVELLPLPVWPDDDHLAGHVPVPLAAGQAVSAALMEKLHALGQLAALAAMEELNLRGALAALAVEHLHFG